MGEKAGIQQGRRGWLLQGGGSHPSFPQGTESWGRARPNPCCLQLQQDLWVEPGVLEAVGGAGPLFRDVLHHGQQEGAELCCLFQGPLVFLHEHLIQTPVLEVVDVPQLSWGAGQL